MCRRFTGEMDMLMDHQQPWFDVLVEHNPQCPTSGAARAWVSMPIGAGKDYVVASAIKHLYDLGSLRHVLYVSAIPGSITAHEMANHAIPHRVLTNKPGEYSAVPGVDIVSPTALYTGHDTWVKYGGYDLIVLDLHINPLLSTPHRRDAALTVLGMDTKVWMVGCGV
jgi:superfamily II DNA or RNA helicase